MSELIAGSFLAPDELKLLQLGGALSRCDCRGVVLYLCGELGMGKTTFSRGVITGFGHRGAVKSPTYTLVEPYEFSGVDVYHFDLYRLGDPEELEYMGIRDYFTPRSLCLIEWPVRGQGVLQRADIELTLNLAGMGRELVWRALSERGAALARAWSDLI
ncbi:tRNA threonylcarbamoyladenosine biosynthesis protein TsaE [Sinobacterium caligoides]|uniref:tRNA threonylcarbamoyladenosine biosynthesis protein TsaE n=1 Tax=Sinobacterium caligoides TaxID=933926 RepID=A0A3N2DG42_9GAMM|nr:tRNA (adenosine(37)-N6)-threonylcarbamoyltransferase complex ATPase subunit type 1 TsaE [Sinobacterium caligoides]ROR98762.1 tRNA threonylcarbamoyladenosine biosynthesis protein TsaE [Sinobacterium caligoides]